MVKKILLKRQHFKDQVVGVKGQDKTFNDSEKTHKDQGKTKTKIEDITFNGQERPSRSQN